LKYTGSKARISFEISSIINKIIEEKDIKTYIEPFVGGGNLMENIVCENKIGSDNNKYLIALWKKLLENGFDEIPEFISKEEYQKVKENKDSGIFPDWYVGLCGICASYNGNWFSSYGGSAVTKDGKTRNYFDESVRNIKNQIPKLKTVKFDCLSHEEIQVNNCFIYCDPPYLKNIKTYNSREFNHEFFWEWVRKMSKTNIVLVSEYSAPDDFKVIWEKQLAKTFPNQREKSPTEKLFVLNNE
jgi:DNA adenine methylase